MEHFLDRLQSLTGCYSATDALLLAFALAVAIGIVYQAVDWLNDRLRERHMALMTPDERWRKANGSRGFEVEDIEDR